MVHNILSEHQKDFEICSDTIILPTPPVHDDEPIPSTSALDTIVNSTTSFDEQEHFGTQNKEYLDSEFHVEFLESCDNLPDLADLEVTLKGESSDNEAAGITFFRALNEDEKKTRRRSRRGKFEPVDVASSTDSD